MAKDTKFARVLKATLPPTKARKLVILTPLRSVPHNNCFSFINCFRAISHSRTVAISHSRTTALCRSRTLKRSNSHSQTTAQTYFCTCTLYAHAISKSRSCVHATEHTQTSHTTSRTFTLLLSHARNIGRRYHRMMTPLRSCSLALWQHRKPALLHSRSTQSRKLSRSRFHTLFHHHTQTFSHMFAFSHYRTLLIHRHPESHTFTL